MKLHFLDNCQEEALREELRRLKNSKQELSSQYEHLKKKHESLDNEKKKLSAAYNKCMADLLEAQQMYDDLLKKTEPKKNRTGPKTTAIQVALHELTF